MALSPGLVPESTTLLVTSLHTLSGHMRTAIALMQAKQLNAAGTHERLQLLVQNTAQFGIVRKESSKQMFAAGQEWFNTCMARGAPGATDLEAATSQCAAAYAALIGAAVAEMQTLDNSLASAQQAQSNVDKVKLFVAIWLCACSTSEWWTSWDSFCAACSAPLDLTALQPVLTTLMTWLLGFMRQGSHMCHALPPYYGRAGPDRQQTNIYACMSTALLLLRIQKAQPLAEVCAAVANLPPSLLPTLCQLACEMNPATRPARLIDVKSNKLEEVLDMMAEDQSYFKAVYDFGGRSMVYSRDDNAVTICTMRTTWRNGTITLSAEQSLTLRDCQVRGAAKGVFLTQEASLTATHLKIDGCGVESVTLEDGSDADLTDVEISGAEAIGLFVTEDCRLTGVRVRVSGTKANVLRTRGNGKLSLTDSWLTGNSGSPGELQCGDRVVLKNCALDSREFLVQDKVLVHVTVD
ncbi:MAG: hypothetical protein WDW38_002002 [Sanguina aurantia]